MTASELLAELHRLGAVAVRVGDRLRIRPAEVVPPALVDRLREHKAELLALVPEQGGPRETVGFDYYASRFADLFVDLTGDVGGAPGDLAAVAWAEMNEWPGIVDTLRALDRRCEVLAAADDEAGFRATVRELVELFATIREAYRTRPVKVKP